MKPEYRETKDRLENLLRSLPTGPVDEDISIMSDLSDLWPFLSGSDAERTTSEKLYRAEDIRWNPPVLSFVLERHGAMVYGSTRGALHHWEVDLTTMSASIVKEGHRQLYPRSKKLDTVKLAQSVSDLIDAGAEHEWLNWRNPAKTSIALNIGKIIPATFKQTTFARRKRFRAALQSLLEQKGWRRVPAGSHLIFSRGDNPESEPSNEVSRA